MPYSQIFSGTLTSDFQSSIKLNYAATHVRFNLNMGWIVGGRIIFCFSNTDSFSGEFIDFRAFTPDKSGILFRVPTGLPWESIYLLVRVYSAAGSVTIDQYYQSQGEVIYVLVFVSNLSELPVTGSTSTLYIITGTNKIFRWNGSSYVELSTDAVVSVFGRTGGISAADNDYSANQISGLSTFIDNEINSSLLVNSPITKTFDALTGNNTLSVDQNSINHNSLLNYTANRHIDHSAVSINAGTGLTGGGLITGNVDLSIPAQTGYTPGTFGNNTNIPQITVNDRGIITGITTVSTGAASSVVADSNTTTPALRSSTTGANSTGIAFTSSGQILLVKNGVEVARYDGTNLELNTNQGIILNSGGHLRLQGRTGVSGSMLTTGMKWYEEGASSNVGFASTGATFAYTTSLRALRYQRIGGLVYFNICVGVSAAPTGTLTNALTITGLPYTVDGQATFSNAEQGTMALFMTSVTLPSNIPTVARAVIGTTTLELTYQGAGLPSARPILTSILGAGSIIQVSGCYFTTYDTTP